MVDLGNEAPSVGQRKTLTRAAAVLLPLATCALLTGFRDSVTSATAALVLVLLVVAAAASGDRAAGVLAALSGAAWFDFFLTEPYQRFTISDPDDVEVTVLLVLISLAVLEIAFWGRRQQARSARQSGYLEGVLSTAKAASEGDTPPEALLDLVSRQIVTVLGVDGCHYIPGPVHDPRLAIIDHDGTLTRSGRAEDVERSGLPFDSEVVIPVRHGRRIIGHFVITAASRIVYPSRQQLRVAVLLADQVASALVDD